MKDIMLWPELDDWLRRALSEDLGSGDVTTEATVDAEALADMKWVAKTDLVVCGLFAGARVFSLLDEDAVSEEEVPEGEAVGPGAVIFRVRGRARDLLSAERVALNIVQHLSGIATLTRVFTKAVAGTRAKIAATRKTLPHWRRFEKYAVTVGGGIPHRFGLSDGVLIKDNHIAAAGSITKAVKRARAQAHHLLKIEVEVTSMKQAAEALAAGAELLLLDNMKAADMATVVKKFRGRAVFEASGNISLANVAEVARTGVDIISVGALTHSAPASDISARLTLLSPGRRRS